MNIEHMKYVVEVARTESITMAAANLSVTQSTISQAITKLEELLDIKLFLRTRRGAYLISECSPIIDKMKDILNSTLAIKEIADYMGEKGKEELRLSVIPGGLPSVIQSISSMKNSYPELKFQLSEQESRIIVQEVREEEIDFGLVAIAADDIDTQLNGLLFHSIERGKLFACVSKENKLSNKKKIKLEDLEGQTFVVFNDEFADPFIEQLTHAGTQVHVLFRSCNSEAIGAALVQLDAVTIGHEYSFRNHLANHNDFVSIDIDMPQRDIVIGWVMKESMSMDSTVKRFMDRYHSLFMDTRS
ncbi:LysR family transcriptional regulator [Paenibacillus sp. JCM 10914]|uniref:LysR family transcriptional regulator n=1 Tax=Paenibacillus sp. JCM 10914 TaxID=1236974 RepID=UPI0003CC3BB7|nr:LysR family transcriptional regulator [Paenibacillus sp. JCM 10914]GAE07473.1 hydrogen peroxide-inducible genes activator [Paenibacillus sp. JCM 10914]